MNIKQIKIMFYFRSFQKNWSSFIFIFKYTKYNQYNERKIIYLIKQTQKNYIMIQLCKIYLFVQLYDHRIFINCLYIEEVFTLSVLIEKKNKSNFI
jgi:hypothetical protein